jgi:site-specific DNA-adenine methylase
MVDVQIEHEDFRKILERYDWEETWFYLDPPYVPDTRVSKKMYAHEMTLDDHKDLVSLMLKGKGKYLLSGYDDPVYQPLTDAGWTDKWDEEALRVSYGFAKEYEKEDKKSKRSEKLWYNYSLLNLGL